MLNYIIIFFFLAVVSGFFGFGGLAADFAGISRLIALIFVVLFVASLLYSMMTGRKANPPL